MAFPLSATSATVTDPTKALTGENYKPPEEMTASELCDALEKIRKIHEDKRIIVGRNLSASHWTTTAKYLINAVDCQAAAPLNPDVNDASNIRKCQKMKNLLLQKMQQSENHIEKTRIYTLLMSNS